MEESEVGPVVEEVVEVEQRIAEAREVGTVVEEVVEGEQRCAEESEVDYDVEKVVVGEKQSAEASYGGEISSEAEEETNEELVGVKVKDNEWSVENESQMRRDRSPNRREMRSHTRGGREV